MEAGVCLPKAEAYESEKPGKECAEDVAALPGVAATAPVHADEEHDETGAEEEDTQPVEGFELLQLGLTSHVKHFLSFVSSRNCERGSTYIGWRVVEEEIENDCECIHNDTKNVAPAPLQSCVLVESTRNRGAKHSERNRCR